MKRAKKEPVIVALMSFELLMKLYLLVELAVVVGGLDEEEVGRLDDKDEDFEEDFVPPLSDFCFCWWL